MTLARYRQDVEEEVSIGISAFSLAKVETLDLRDRAGQACFLCLETPLQGQYALPIPCLRPTRPRRITQYTGLSTNPNNRKPSDECDVRMSEWGEPCIRLAAKEAEQRLKLLDDIQHLKKCARDPASANGLRTLEGMAQESCIYDVKYE
ncbi:hypothetical protein FOIG_04658 [Fusarium odoratissimum NRRL 54006]|uniref:Uncharacterized protein n=1 Tax=Fusarium odoratissimum (strain NRRL 54006) TaxID=1089451 RepID=X0K6S4_FUSO5|nr:uncharacterized protein FOIG_04658 [Fusarium odoratissimum NRRL 54006]EXM04442.1 hypothetical protein FOIG_04658 [Fusarium odoratissimum NRRL 54006]